MEDIQDDPRFAHILSDPKFMVMPKSKKKVKIDARFRSVFTSDKFSHKTDIDKRGRPIFDATKRNSHVMKRFYELSDDDDEDNDDVKSESGQEVAHKQQNDKRNKSKRPRVDDDVSTKSFSQTESQPQRHIPEEQNKKQDKKKTPTKNNVDKLVSGRKDKTVSVKSSSVKDSSSDQEGSSSCTTDDDDEEEDDGDIELPEFSQEFALEETDIEHKWNELHTDAVTVVESTCRLAVCNMDWDFVKAQDLFVLFKSFVPDGGQVKSVTIYPSEFGKERMAEEAMLGPREIRAQTNQESVKADKEGQNGRKKNRATNQQQAKRASKDLEATQTEKLREYQLNRLRYYFAVVDCDSVVTAENIYNECDGREYLLSSVRLDLRFIPDGMTFDDPPREVFSQEQSILEYKPNQFSSTALCQAKVDVTWDETEFDRLSRRIGGMQHKELESIVEENKYADIIAPPESDSDQDADDQPDWLKQALDSNGDEELNEEDKIAMYRKLLMEKLDDEEGDDDGDELKGEEKELVWTPGLKSSLVKRMERKERKQENTGVVNDYLEKKREKKKKKKQNKAKKQTVNETEQADTVDNNTNENTGAVSAHKQAKKKKKKQKRDENEEKAEAKNMADLELLVMGDGDVKDDHTDKEKTSKKKSKKLKMKKKLMEVKDEFQLDMDDPRFGALYTSQHFHIDPSSSQFKKSTHMADLMNEQIKRRGQSGKPVNVTGSKSDQSVEPSKSLSQALVDSIKSKMRK